MLCTSKPAVLETQTPHGRDGLGNARGSEGAELILRALVALLNGAIVPRGGNVLVSRVLVLYTPKPQE